MEQDVKRLNRVAVLKKLLVQAIFQLTDEYILDFARNGLVCRPRHLELSLVSVIPALLIENVKGEQAVR